MILNFHPIYSGGNLYDVGEYFRYDPDQNTSEIIIYDYDEGGNGVSELIGYYIPDIVCRAIDVMYRRHRHGLPQYRFLGEPGDVILGKWPRCPYGNVGLSRALLIVFLETLLGVPLDQVSPSLVEQYIPRVR